MDSILNTIKQMLGLNPMNNDFHQDAFDVDLIVNINSAFMTLQQLGVGPSEGFSIVGSEEQWTDFMEQSTILEECKRYIYLKTRLGFDPPTSSFVIDAIERMIKESEWRMNIASEEGENQNEL